MRSIVITGASRGLGHSMIEGLGHKDDQFYLISRSLPDDAAKPTVYKKNWISANLSHPDSVDTIMSTIGKIPVDVLIYNAGIWENVDFESVTADEVSSIIAVNLTSAILLSQKMLPNIRKGNLKKIIFIGSTYGLENGGSDSVIYNSTKFAVRGLTHSLREYVRKDGISVTCISPGSIASDVSFNEGVEAALDNHSGKKIPVQDIINIIKMVIDSSNATCVKEIIVPALFDTDI